MADVGLYRHLVRVQHPGGTPVPNGDGGFSQPWIDGSPSTWHCAIDEGPGVQERTAAGTTIAEGGRIFRGRYRADITNRSRLIYGARAFTVVGVTNPQSRNIDLELSCVEVLA